MLRKEREKGIQNSEAEGGQKLVGESTASCGEHPEGNGGRNWTRGSGIPTQSRQLPTKEDKTCRYLNPKGR